MAFTVTGYTFSKKVNSTARPSGGTTFSVDLKGQSDILAPTILLSVVGIPSYNYYYIAEFSRYYFVTSVTWIDGLWEVSMKIDALASWKDNIGGQSLYVTRALTTSGGEIKDDLYPITNDYSTVREVKSELWNTSDIDNGIFVVGLAGQTNIYHAFTKTGFYEFLENLFSDDYVDSVLGSLVLSATAKASLNASQYITSCMWFPFSYSTSAGLDAIAIGFGAVDLTFSQNFIMDEDYIYNTNFSFDISAMRHPQSARGVYLNSEPYSIYKLFVPPFGIISLDSNSMANNSTLFCDIDVDMRTGKATLEVFTGDSDFMCRLDGQIGVSYQVTQIAQNRGLGIGQIVSTAVSAGVAIANPATTPLAISNVANTIGDYQNNRIPVTSTIGSDSGVNTLKGTPILYVSHRTIVDEDYINKGRPLCEVRTINTLSGFVMVSDANISIPCTEEEQQQIRSFMEGGFFYE